MQMPLLMASWFASLVVRRLMFVLAVGLASRLGGLVCPVGVTLAARAVDSGPPPVPV